MIIASPFVQLGSVSSDDIFPGSDVSFLLINSSFLVMLHATLSVFHLGKKVRSTYAVFLFGHPLRDCVCNTFSVRGGTEHSCLKFKLFPCDMSKASMSCYVVRLFVCPSHASLCHPLTMCFSYVTKLEVLPVCDLYYS